MARIRRKAAIALFAALAATGALALPAAAMHDGEIADCGAAGMFTIEAQPNGAGFEAPGFGDVLLFEEGGRLTVLKLVANGQISFEFAAVGRANNNVEEITCSFTLPNGPFVELTGILAGR